MKNEKLKPQCISCLLNRHLNSAPESFSDEQKLRYMQGILKIVADAEAFTSAPEILEKIYNFKKSMNITSDFSEIKSRFNDYMLSLETEIEGKIENSLSPLKTAVKYAIVGNYIDFGALNNVAFTKLDEMISKAENILLDENVFRTFEKEIINAEKIVYLTDNCGEIVMDKLLVKQLIKHSPHAQIDVIVRGKDVINDSTIIDAEQVGLTKLTTVIGNGTGIAGTCLERISKEAKNKIDNADIIISKGQGNFETLYPSNKNVYYLFLCKCEMFAQKFGVKNFTGMFIREKN